MASAENEAEEKAPAREAPPSGADAQALAFREAITQVRNRSDLTAKAIAGVGGSAIGAIGLAKFADIFPFDACWLWAVGLAVGFAAMVAGVTTLARRFLRVQRPIVMRSDIRLISDVNRPELQEIQRAFDDTAAFNDADNLLAYEARAHRLLRVARFLTPERAKEVTAEAESILGDVRATHARAAHAAVLRRADRATQGRWGKASIASIAVGFALAAVSIDAIDSARDTAEQKACAEAAKAGVAIGALPDDCPDLDPEIIKPPPDPAAADPPVE